MHLSLCIGKSILRCGPVDPAKSGRVQHYIYIIYIIDGIRAVSPSSRFVVIHLESFITDSFALTNSPNPDDLLRFLKVH